MAIHLEASVGAGPQEVYTVLSEGERFAAVTGMPALGAPAAGAPFTAFGGRIEGRVVELVPGERVVQAWRFGEEHPDAWQPGVYSIVRFALTPEAGGTRLRIDHDGIPAEWEEHIRDGYPAFYADPIVRYFAHLAPS